MICHFINSIYRAKADPRNPLSGSIHRPFGTDAGRVPITFPKSVDLCGSVDFGSNLIDEVNARSLFIVNLAISSYYCSTYKSQSIR
jgi:hypothetical protein